MEFKKKDLIQKNQSLNEDWIENGLMLAGFVPVIGEIADIILIIRYLSKGEYIYAGLMLVALIPMVGDVIAKPFIKLLQSSGAGKLAMKGTDEMVEYLSKNPKAKEEFIKMSKYFNHSGVNETIKAVSKINGNFGSKMANSISKLKNVTLKLKPVQMVKRVGKEVAVGGKVSTGMKSFFREKRLSDYVAKKGIEPTNWLSKWWNITRGGRADRRAMFRNVILASGILDTLGLPDLSVNELDDRMKDPAFLNALAQNPQTSQFIGQNTEPQDLKNIETNLTSLSQDSGVPTLFGTAINLGMLKKLANSFV
jgi:hypothetical protein